jgi:hypothetical protein
MFITFVADAIKYNDGKKSIIRLRWSSMFSASVCNRKQPLVFHLAVCVSVFLAVALKTGFYPYSLFKTLTVLGWWRLNVDIVAAKMVGLHIVPQYKIAMFSKMAHDFDEILVCKGLECAIESEGLL